MKAIVYQEFGGSLTLDEVSDPVPDDDGVVLKVGATGLCRSDWHGWMGHDPDITLPHVPGHELAGTVQAVGTNVKKWRIGDRVTLPFVCGCGHCPQCHSGNQQVCDHQFQPGFTHWGSFAEYVAIQHADVNLVRLPDSMTFTTAASLGCRFITSYRAVVDQGKIKSVQWVAVHGCGGVGLSAIMIARAYGAQIIAVDIDDDKLRFAQTIGAQHSINAKEVKDVSMAIKEVSSGGAHISVDALGSLQTCINSISCLTKRGKHVQIGLMAGADSLPEVPMSLVIANELEIIGSHGMQAHRYPEMLDMIAKGLLEPQQLIGRTVELKDAIELLPQMDHFNGTGVTVITSFN